MFRRRNVDGFAGLGIAAFALFAGADLEGSKTDKLNFAAFGKFFLYAFHYCFNCDSCGLLGALGLGSYRGNEFRFVHMGTYLLYIWF